MKTKIKKALAAGILLAAIIDIFLWFCHEHNFSKRANDLLALHDQYN